LAAASRRLVLTGLACFSMVGAADAYNHDQHQGIVVLGYKAVVTPVLEKGCPVPVYFPSGAPESLRTYPTGFCGGEEGACQARWDALLTDLERAIDFLHRTSSSLTAPVTGGCQDPRSGANTLGEVTLAVDRFYNRDDGPDRDYCGIPPPEENSPDCSAPLNLCHVGSIYKFLAPDDHTGDVLGYWATEPDDDADATVLGFKPTNLLGAGRTIDMANDLVESALAALAAPVVCVVHFLSTGDLDCLNNARSLADAAVPLEELHGILPVIGKLRDAGGLSGLWHFQNHVNGVSNECDDLQGMLYEEAGPGRVPDAVDLGLAWFNDRFAMTLNYDESTGPQRFNITDPDDGDQPSCVRGRADWEAASIGSTTFSPLDNLALDGWKRFATSRQARDLGGPLHAIGDAVAPHHVVGTTGWGHRPFEDAAELHWRRIVFIETAGSDEERWRLQYEQLRRILAWAFHYAQALDQLRAERPTDQPHNTIPIRALITRIGAETLAETTEPTTGAPLWPFNPLISVPYIYDGMGFKTQILTTVYGTEDGVARTRALLERGAVAAFLSFIWQLEGETSLPFSPCDANLGDATTAFFTCGANAYCSSVNFPAVPPYGCCFGNF